MGWGDGLEDVISYFQNLYKEGEIECQEVVNCIPRTINEEQNSLLCRSTDEKKVKDVTNGMTPGFYQRYYQLLGVMWSSWR